MTDADTDNNISKDLKENKESNSSFVERMGKWNVTKNNLNWIFGLSSLAITGLFICACFNDRLKWIGNLIGTLGGLASIFGIYLTMCQIIEAKKDIIKVTAIANATKIATEETRQSLRKTLSVANVAKYCERIKLIQDKINHKELEFVIHLIQDLQDAIIELQKYLKSVNISFDEDSMQNHIIKMGMNLSFIRKAIDQNNEKYKKAEILKDFDELFIVISDLKAKLTTHDNGQQEFTV